MRPSIPQDQIYNEVVNHIAFCQAHQEIDMTEYLSNVIVNNFNVFGYNEEENQRFCYTLRAIISEDLPDYQNILFGIAGHLFTTSTSIAGMRQENIIRMAMIVDENFQDRMFISSPPKGEEVHNLGGVQRIGQFEIASPPKGPGGGR